MTDLFLTVLHHLLVFALVAVFAMEAALMRPGLNGAALSRLSRIDGAYGALAGAVLIVGFARALLGVRGWEFYASYWVFWAKVAAFALVGVLSIPPTLAIRRWAKNAKSQGAPVPEGEIAMARRWIGRQAGVLLLIPILAAMMARGVGY